MAALLFLVCPQKDVRDTVPRAPVSARRHFPSLSGADLLHGEEPEAH